MYFDLFNVIIIVRQFALRFRKSFRLLRVFSLVDLFWLFSCVALSLFRAFLFCCAGLRLFSAFFVIAFSFIAFLIIKILFTILAFLLVIWYVKTFL